MTTGPKKMYGLLNPKTDLVNTNEPRLSRTVTCAFNNDSDSSENGSDNQDWLKKSLDTSATNKRRQTKLQEKALIEDPTIYQYDEVYDEMESSKNSAKMSKKDPQRKPKYIERLKMQADRRKLENERRLERQIQKERDTEGDEFKDKEAFVTSAYKKKLEEYEKMIEDEKYRDMLEDITDVTKQKDMTGFYRHLYRVKTNEKKNKEIIPIAEKSEKIEQIEIESAKQNENQTKSNKRQYRTRKHSSSSSDSDENIKDKNIDTDTSKDINEERDIEAKHDIVSEQDIDADTSMSSSSEDEEEGKENRIVKKNKISEKKIKSEPKNEPNSDDKSNREEEENKNEEEERAKKEKEKAERKKRLEEIWKKRTVGAVFDEALKRYYQRKADRSSGR